MAIEPDARSVIVVDSNTWADYFNGRSAPHVDRLDAALEGAEDLAVLPIIVTEVLQGLRSERGFREARKMLVRLPVLQPTLDCHLRAAGLFRTLRRKGVTVRGAVDCVIAQASIDLGALLISPDRDFRFIASHTALRLWSV